jgi:hypothetical protein
MAKRRHLSIVTLKCYKTDKDSICHRSINRGAAHG